MAYTENIYKSEIITNENDAETQAYIDSAEGLVSTVVPIAGVFDTLADTGISINNTIGDSIDNRGVSQGISALNTIIKPSDDYGRQIENLQNGEDIGMSLLELGLPGLAGINSFNENEEELEKSLVREKKINDTAQGFDPTGGTRKGRISGGTEFQESTIYNNSRIAKKEGITGAGLVTAASSLYSSYSSMSENDAGDGFDYDEAQQAKYDEIFKNSNTADAFETALA